MEIGAQLYTVRDFCKTTEDFSQTLKKISDIGYKNVQVSGTCDYDPAWLKRELDKNGLRCVLTHIPQERLVNDTVAVAKDHNIFDCSYVGLGWYDFGSSDFKEKLNSFKSTFSDVAKTLYDNGKYFMYHNHGTEFYKHNGKIILDHMAEMIPSKYMGFTLDTFWAQVGGADPAQCIEKLSGRVPVIHLKDYAYDRKMAVVGEGNINFDRVFEKAEAAGTHYMLVEQDDCNGEDPFDCLARSYKNLKALGLC